MRTGNNQLYPGAKVRKIDSFGQLEKQGTGNETGNGNGNRNGKRERKREQEIKRVDHVSHIEREVCVTSTNAMDICCQIVCCMKEAMNWKLAALDERPRCIH